MPGSWWRCLASEIGLVMRRRRNQVLLAGLAALPIVIGLAVKLVSSQASGRAVLISRMTESGLFLAAVVFVAAMPLFLPLAIAVVAGDALAAEAQQGTLRYAMILPVSRSRWLAMKGVGLLAYVVVSVATVLVVSLLTGFVLFGAHPLTLLSGDTISLWAGVGRLALMSAYVVASETGLIAVGLFVSSLTDVPIVAMVGTAMVPVICTMLLAVPQLQAIQPGLLTYHWLDITTFLFAQPDVTLVRHGLLVQLAWVALFGSLAWARVASMDVKA